MSRAASWKSLAIVVGAILAVAVICIAIGNTSLASALIVVAIVEGAAHALWISFSSAKGKRNDVRPV